MDIRKSIEIRTSKGVRILILMSSYLYVYDLCSSLFWLNCCIQLIIFYIFWIDETVEVLDFVVFVSSESAKANSGSSCGSKLKEWTRDIELDLGILDDDYVHKKDSPVESSTEVTSSVAKEKEKYVQWYEFNKMALELSIDIMNGKNRRNRKRKIRAMNSTPSSSNAAGM